MEDTSPWRVVETGAETSHARRRRRLLRAAALCGGLHVPDLFDAAVLAHRRVESVARAALMALEAGTQPRSLRVRPNWLDRAERRAG